MSIYINRVYSVPFFCNKISGMLVPLATEVASASDKINDRTLYINLCLNALRCYTFILVTVHLVCTAEMHLLCGFLCV